MMLMLPLARGGARGPAQAQLVGARHLRLDRDGRHLSQDQPICRAAPARRAGSTRSSPCGCRSCCFAALIVWMYHDDRPRPGGQPIGALERGFARLGKPIALAARRAPAARPAHDQPAILPVAPAGASTWRELFLTRSLAVLVALVLVLMTLDLLGESGKILAVPGQRRCRAVALCVAARAAADRRASCPFRCCSAR